MKYITLLALLLLGALGYLAYKNPEKAGNFLVQKVGLGTGTSMNFMEEGFRRACASEKARSNSGMSEADCLARLEANKGQCRAEMLKTTPAKVEDINAAKGLAQHYMNCLFAGTLTGEAEAAGAGPVMAQELSPREMASQHMGNPVAVNEFLGSYQRYQDHRAFAYASDGSYGYSGNGKASVEAATREALSLCEQRRHGAATCEVVNVDGNWTR